MDKQYDLGTSSVHKRIFISMDVTSVHELLPFKHNKQILIMILHNIIEDQNIINIILNKV